MPFVPTGRATLGACLTAAALLRAAPVLSDDRPVTFTRDVAPIIFRHCTACHRPGEPAPFNLLTYEDVRQRARQIATITEHRYMPPWKPEPGFGEFEGERRLHDEEIATLKEWVEQGAIEGEPRDLPPLPRFAQGWQLGKPDLVLTMSTRFAVPAEGVDLFQNFVLPVPLGERRYVQAVEFRPGNAKVVHHARILIDETGEARQRDVEQPGPGFEGMEAPGAHFPDGHFLGWAPGKMPRRESLAWPLPARSDVVIQIHLKPTGRPESVQASVGLYFTSKPPAAKPILLRLGSKTIDIPAGETKYVVVDAFELPVDVKALSIYPHAHYLGKDMTIVARMPDGTIERLLHIAEWDFNWQDEYEYAEPVDLPRGAVLEMRYTYDNSAGNPHNRHSPPRRVVSGPGSADEMGELLVQLLPKNAADGEVLHAIVTRETLLMDIAGEEKRVADHPGDFEVRNSLGVHYIQAKRVDDALAQFRASIATEPDHAPALYNLAVLAFLNGDIAEAIGHFEHALAVQPDYAEAHTNYGVLLESIDRSEDAIAHFKKALMVRPDHAIALGNMGRMLMRRGKPQEAISHFDRLRELQPDNPALLDALAAAYAAAGQPSRAAAVAQDALRLAIAAKNDQLARDIRARLQQYEEDASGAPLGLRGRPIF
jgi:tetratricopeptide (TPR) repeat protein/mono/diheme cytochrome c family protein